MASDRIRLFKVALQSERNPEPQLLVVDKLKNPFRLYLVIVGSQSIHLPFLWAQCGELAGLFAGRIGRVESRAARGHARAEPSRDELSLWMENDEEDEADWTRVFIRSDEARNIAEQLRNLERGSAT